MKVNKAPKKIYINPNLENRTWLIGKGDTSFIEYTRTDAFIEKACNWFRNLDDKEPSFETTEEFIEGFKKAMKGE